MLCFVKQKTAYEMRISDWSSDVCSSDLEAPDAGVAAAQRYGDQLVNAERYAEAARMYDTAIARAGARATWLLWLQKGGALQQSGAWENARPPPEQARDLAPNTRTVPNSMGSATLEHGGDPGTAPTGAQTDNAR